MVHGLASQLGGALTIDSEPGLGTNIEVWLPTSSNPLIQEPTRADIAPLAPVGRRALLVDDEEAVRISTADMLIELGYSVVEAASATEALPLLQACGEIDVLVTDHLMPGMTGAELARTAKANNPELKVLLVSGYAEAGGIGPELVRLEKPFRQKELAAKLAEVDLDASK
jgi:CheY-like chemotaxis protein